MSCGTADDQVEGRREALGGRIGLPQSDRSKLSSIPQPSSPAMSHDPLRPPSGSGAGGLSGDENAGAKPHADRVAAWDVTTATEGLAGSMDAGGDDEAPERNAARPPGRPRSRRP
jgi:hypothetical protein